MKWNELPPEIQEKMLERQKEQYGKRYSEAFEKYLLDSINGFVWSKTPEGYDFWSNILQWGLIDEFYKVYPKTTEMKNTITRKQLIEAYREFSCPLWRSSIHNILHENLLKSDDELIEIKEDYIALLLREGSVHQKEYAKVLGLTLQEDKNAFIAEFSAITTHKISKELFGKEHVLLILNDTCPKDRPDLKGKAFSVDNDYEVILGKGTTGRTTIEIKKK